MEIQVLTRLAEYFQYSDDEAVQYKDDDNPTRFLHEQKEEEEDSEVEIQDEDRPEQVEIDITEDEPEKLEVNFVSDSKTAQNESFGHEEFEVERLNEILRDHIQLQRDEYYQESFVTQQEATHPAANGTEFESIPPITEQRNIQYECFNLPVSYN